MNKIQLIVLIILYITGFIYTIYMIVKAKRDGRYEYNGGKFPEWIGVPVVILLWPIAWAPTMRMLFRQAKEEVRKRRQKNLKS